MPIFKLQCCACSAVFEKLVFSQNLSGVTCPECNSDKIEKRPTTAAFKFVGEGFHATDYPSVDKVVGADASKRWEAIDRRNAERSELESSIGPNEKVVREPDGTYGVEQKQKDTVQSA